MKKVIAIVEKHMDNIEFSTEISVREMRMSHSNLYIKMKVLTEESANDFTRRVRSNQACKLLKEGKYTVSEVSEIVSFSIPSYSATNSKKYFDCLSSEYGK